MGYIGRVNSSYYRDWSGTFAEDLEKFSWTYTPGDHIDVPCISTNGCYMKKRQGTDELIPSNRDVSTIRNVVIHTTGGWKGPSERVNRAYFATQAAIAICKKDGLSREIKRTLINHVFERVTTKAFRILSANHGINYLLKETLTEEEVIKTIGNMNAPPLKHISNSRPEALFFFKLMHNNFEPDVENFEGDFWKALAGFSYAFTFAANFKYKGHFLIDWTGAIHQVLPIDYIAGHVGGGRQTKVKLSKYSFDNTKPYDGGIGDLDNEKRFEYWGKRWLPRGYRTITELPCWDADPSGRVDVNRFSIGIDILATHPRNGDYAGSPTNWTNEQYNSLGRLISEFVDDPRLSILPDKSRIIGHEDAHPPQRVGCCPGRQFDWDRLYSLTGLDS